MAQFSYSAWLDRQAKTYKAEIKEKVKLPDPTGVEPPQQFVLDGSAEAHTDEALADLIQRQTLEKIPTKQRMPDTETGATRTRLRPFTKAELATAVLLRSAVKEALENGESVPGMEEEEGKTKRKPRNRINEPEPTVSNGEAHAG